MKRKKYEKVKAAHSDSMFYCRSGFTIAELIISITIVAILSAMAVYFIDPVKQLAKSRNTQRKAHVNVISNAIAQNVFDNRGSFSCSSGAIPTSTTRMTTSTGGYNIGPCLVPTYLDSLPLDPSTSGVRFKSQDDYDTGYYIAKSTTTGRVTISAPAAELGESISVTR